MTKILQNLKTAMLLSVAVFFSSCSILNSRPAKQMSYAEAAFKAATQASAETNPASAIMYQMARDQLARARSYYRLKNFKNARYYAIRARRLAEDAELKALKGDSGGSSPETLVK